MEVLVEAVVTGILTFKSLSIDIAGVVPTVEPLPINKSSAESSRAIYYSCALPSNTILVSSAPASPIVRVGVVPARTIAPLN